MNPYASYLGNRNPLDVISETPRQLENLIATLGPNRVEQSPAPGKWSPREILCHLADCEVVFAFRFRQTLAENHHVIQPFDQDKWAKAYGTYSVIDALATYAALRAWNLKFFAALAPDAYSKRVTHPERGEMSFRDVVETMAGHDLNHLRQLEAIAARPATAG